MTQEGRRKLISEEPVERQTVGQGGRSALSRREKLLLASILLVVVGWILLRLLLTLFAPPEWRDRFDHDQRIFGQLQYQGLLSAVRAIMEARDVMVSPVITLEENEAVRCVAELLIARRITVPVVDSAGRLIGIVTEAGLMNILMTSESPA
jgi:CBS domain-containing protein